MTWKTVGAVAFFCVSLFLFAYTTRAPSPHHRLPQQIGFYEAMSPQQARAQCPSVFAELNDGATARLSGVQSDAQCYLLIHCGPALVVVVRHVVQGNMAFSADGICASFK